MWEVKIWMFRELWALMLVVMFAYPLHEISYRLWEFLRARKVTIPRHVRLEVWITILAIQAIILLTGLTLFLIS